MNALEVCGVLFLLQIGFIVTVVLLNAILTTMKEKRDLAKKVLYDALEKDMSVNGKQLTMAEKLDMMSNKSNKFDEFAKEIFGKTATEQDIANFMNYVSNLKETEKEMKKTTKKKIEKRV